MGTLKNRRPNLQEVTEVAFLTTESQSDLVTNSYYTMN